MKISKVTNADSFIEMFAPELRNLDALQQASMIKSIGNLPWEKEVNIYIREPEEVYNCVKISLEKTRKKDDTPFIIGVNLKNTDDKYTLILRMYHGKFEINSNLNTLNREMCWKLSLTEMYTSSIEFYTVLFGKD